jgi:hypothetical protein
MLRNRYQIVIKHFHYVLDRFREPLSTIISQRAKHPGSRQVTAGALILVLAAGLIAGVPTGSKEKALITTTLARATQLTDGLKPHARRLVQDPKQLKCLSQILGKESNWSPRARNGSHYGIGQMRSKWYGSLSGIDQITETVRYIKHRYKTMCLAWAFHERNNYY